MNMRKKRFKAVQKAGGYSSAAAGASMSGMECLTACFVVPAVIKWPIVALVGLVAAKIGYNSSMNESEQEEKKVAALAAEEAKLAAERKEVATEIHRVHDDLLKMAGELQAYQRHRTRHGESKNGEIELGRIKAILKKWRHLNGSRLTATEPADIFSPQGGDGRQIDFGVSSPASIASPTLRAEHYIDFGSTNPASVSPAIGRGLRVSVSTDDANLLSRVRSSSPSMTASSGSGMFTSPKTPSTPPLTSSQSTQPLTLPRSSSQLDDSSMTTVGLFSPGRPPRVPKRFVHSQSEEANLSRFKMQSPASHKLAGGISAVVNPGGESKVSDAEGLKNPTPSSVTLR